MRHSQIKTWCMLLIASSFIYLVEAGEAFAQPCEANCDDTIALDGEALNLMTTDEMEVNRGAAGDNSLASTQSLAATTSGNSLFVGGNLTNGDIAIGDNLGGFGSYVMNTGNNSTINTAVSVNVQFVSTP